MKGNKMKTNIFDDDPHFAAMKISQEFIDRLTDDEKARANKTGATINVGDYLVICADRFIPADKFFKNFVLEDEEIVEGFTPIIPIEE